jgi:hypothetical protein
MCKNYILFALASVLIAVAILLWPPKTSRDNHSSVLVHPLLNFDREQFFYTLNRASPESTPTQPIAGAVIPHHLLAGSLIARMFDRIKWQNPRTVILLAPNHKELGIQKVISGLESWDTPFGLLSTDTSLTNTLTQNKLVGIDEEVLAQENAVIDLVPYIKYFLPNSTIAPLIISSRLTLTEIDELAVLLAKNSSSQTIIVATVDFAHYIDYPTAVINDSQTQEAIQNRDYARLIHWGNDHLDSPATLILLLKTLEVKGTSDVTILDHTDAAQISGNYVAETTSYFLLEFPALPFIPDK